MSDVITPQFTFYGKKAPNTMKNRMLIKLFDPSENALPFIYDDFEWSHCAAMVRTSFVVVLSTLCLVVGTAAAVLGWSGIAETNKGRSSAVGTLRWGR